MPLEDIHEVYYRHEVMQDLEDELLYGYISEFTQKMRLMRQHILQSDKLYYKYQKIFKTDQ